MDEFDTRTEICREHSKRMLSMRIIRVKKSDPYSHNKKTQDFFRHFFFSKARDVPHTLVHLSTVHHLEFRLSAFLLRIH